jgi:hypothetical protein
VERDIGCQLTELPICLCIELHECLNDGSKAVQLVVYMRAFKVGCRLLRATSGMNLAAYGQACVVCREKPLARYAEA